MEHRAEARLNEHSRQRRQTSKPPSISRAEFSRWLGKQNSNHRDDCQCAQQQAQQTCADDPEVSGGLQPFIMHLLGNIGGEATLQRLVRESETLPTEAPTATARKWVQADAGHCDSQEI